MHPVNPPAKKAAKPSDVDVLQTKRLIDAFIDKEEPYLKTITRLRKALEKLASAHDELWYVRHGVGLTLKAGQLQQTPGLIELKPFFKKLYPIGNIQSAGAVTELITQGKGFDAGYAQYIDAARMVLVEAVAELKESGGENKNFATSFTAKIETFCRKLDVQCRKQQAAPGEDVKSLTPQWAARLKSENRFSKGGPGSGGRGEG